MLSITSIAKTKAMEKQAIEHKKSQTSVMKNVPPSQRGGNGGCFLKGTPITMDNVQQNQMPKLI